MKKKYEIDGAKVAIKSLTHSTVVYMTEDKKQFKVDRKWFNQNAKLTK